VILLDTHAWIWWLGQRERLSDAAAAAIDEAVERGEVVVSAISAWEMAMLVERGRLELDWEVEDWVERFAALPLARFEPIDHRIAVAAVHLPPGLHPDPADRIIVATARTLGVPLVTKDERLRRYEYVETIW
jgi:PIN domain nuclease of toxin-antitoxin system